MQLTIKLLSLLRQKQDTYSYEYFHEPPVIPQKLKEVRVFYGTQELVYGM